MTPLAARASLLVLAAFGFGACSAGDGAAPWGRGGAGDDDDRDSANEHDPARRADGAPGAPGAERERGSGAGCASDASCNGHGVCPAAGGACACDEGFAAPDCATRNADYGRRFEVMKDLADPDVLALGDDRFVLSGTGPRNVLDLFESQDLAAWTRAATYDPSKADPDADYCFVWAPEIVKDGERLWLYFSAHRGPKGATRCPPPAGSDVTTYRAVSPDGSLTGFGKPEPLFARTSGPRTYSAAGCPPEGCSRAIRIDSTVHDGRLYYVFFENGNAIASVSLANGADLRVHARAANPFEEGINEAPELLARSGKQYLFFSAARFDTQYATFYVIGDRAADLTRQRPIHRLTTPVRRKNGTLAETHGHNAIATRRGEAFNFFHVGVFDGAGRLVRRDTWRQRLVWKPDGTAMSQNEVRVAWSALGGGNRYSLDLVLRDGTVIGPCINAGTIGERTTATFVGICPDAGDRLVHKSDVAAFRLYASPSDAFALVGTATYDGISDAVQIETAP